MPGAISGSQYGIAVRGSRRTNLANVQNPFDLGIMLYPFQRMDVFYLDEDFRNATISGDWTLTNDNSGTNFATPGTPGVSGTAVGVTAAVSGNGIGLRGPAQWKAALNCGMEVRFHVGAAITNVQVEIGFEAAITDAKDPIVTDVDVPTLSNGATDLAALVSDVSQTNTKITLATLGGSPVYAAQVAPTTQILVAVTYQTWRIQCIGATVIGQIYDANQVLLQQVSLPLGVGTAALAPYISVNTLTGTAKTVTVDYLRAWQDRV